MELSDDELQDRLIGELGQRRIFDADTLRRFLTGQPPTPLEVEQQVLAQLSPQKLADARYLTAFDVGRGLIVFFPAEVKCPVEFPQFEAYLAIGAEPRPATDFGAAWLRKNAQPNGQSGERLFARLPDGRPARLKWAGLARRNHHLFEQAKVATLELDGRALEVTEWWRGERGQMTAAPRGSEFDASIFLEGNPPVQLLAAVTGKSFHGWYGVRGHTSRTLHAEPGTPAESVWESYDSELLIDPTLCRAIFTFSHRIDASA